MVPTLKERPNRSITPGLSTLWNGIGPRLRIKQLLLSMQDITYTDHTGQTLPRSVFADDELFLTSRRRTQTRPKAVRRRLA
jgi:hypothetical protein